MWRISKARRDSIFYGTVGVVIGVLSSVAVTTPAIAQPFSSQIQQAINLLTRGQTPFTNLRILAAGYLNFGTVIGTTGFGIRNNAGVIEVKSSGGAWAAISTTAAGQAFAATVTITSAGLAATPSNTTVGSGIIFQNTTAATAGATVQWMSGPAYVAHAWDTDDLVDRTVRCYWALQPVSGTTVTSQMVLNCDNSPFAGGGTTGFVNPFRVNNGGSATFLGSIVGGTSSSLGFTNKTIFAASANGLLQIAKNAGVAAPAVEMNLGTAVPTVANCSVGTTGVIDAHSTNTAGSVTPGTGSTACDVVFGAPAYSFAPFCTITDYTSVILAPRISARSTTGFTVDGLTAGDRFGFICLGGT